MVKRMRRQGTRGYQRGQRRRVGGIVNTVRHVESRVSQLERTKEETKLALYSDAGVTGGATFFGVSPGYNLRAVAPFLFLINGRVRGDTVQDRTGDFAIWTKIRARLRVILGTAIVNETWIKWRLIQEYRPDGLALTTGTYFNNVFGVTTPGSIGRQLLPNINNRDQVVKYKTLKQGTLIVTGLNDQSVEERYIDIDWYGKGIKTNYARGNVGNIQDIDRNAIYLIVWTNQTDTTLNGVYVTGEMQARFHG